MGLKILDRDGNELQESDLDLSIGHLIQTNRIKPDVIPIDDIEKFAYDDDDYEDILLYIEPPEEEYLNQQIDGLKRQLADTDYCILKVMEGVATLADYADTITQRKDWRAKINELEEKLSTLNAKEE